MLCTFLDYVNANLIVKLPKWKWWNTIGNQIKLSAQPGICMTVNKGWERVFWNIKVKESRYIALFVVNKSLNQYLICGPYLLSSINS